MQLSVVVPALNEADGIEQCLAALCGAVPAGLQWEVLVVDGGSDDGTGDRAQAAGAVVLHSARGRARQMNLGARHARGQYLLFLHSDTRLPTGLSAWWQALQASQSIWGFFSLRLSGKSSTFRIIEWAISQRSRCSAVATGDQAQFVRRDVFQRLGGFAAIALMEDVELSKRLRRIEQPMVWHEPVLTSSRRWEEGGVMRTVVLMWALRLGYWLGVSPSRLARVYRSGYRARAQASPRL